MLSTISLQSVKSILNAAVLQALLLGFAFWHDAVCADEKVNSTQYEITPYLWAASINGTTAVEGEESPPVDSGYSFFSMDNLDGVASATFTARGNQWGFLFDFLYVAFEDTFVEGTRLQTTTRLEGRIIEFAGTYKPMQELDIVGGLRQQKIDVGLSIVGKEPQASVDWIDPFVGLIYSHPFTENFHLSLRGDLGGFGIESDLAVNAEAMLRYQFNKTLSAKFGYRYLKVKFKDTDFIYDLSLDGLLFGLGIRF